MKLTGILAALQQGHVPGSRSLSFAFDAESKLTLGTIIKGKVLRHFEGSRYSVDFGGRERIVDSSIPMTTDEIIHGRVIAVNDKVHLQRLHATGVHNPAAAAALNQPLGDITTAGERIILQIFNQYQERLAQADFRHLNSMLSKAAQPELMALSALILSKSGSPLAPEFVRAIYAHLQSGLERTSANAHTPQLTTAATSAGAEVDHSVVATLAAIIAPLHQRYSAAPQRQLRPQSTPTTATIDDATISGAKDGMRAGTQEPEPQLSERLFNVQNHNSVGHRLLHFPLWLGDRLVDVQLAFFAQQQNNTANGRYRKIVFSLDTDNLGHVEVTVNLAQQHAKIDFTTEQQSATAFLSRYSDHVADAFTKLGFSADELNYSTVEGFDNGVLNAVVEHHITQDSVSRLM